jgi:hypothetical protein
MVPVRSPRPGSLSLEKKIKEIVNNIPKFKKKQIFCVFFLNLLNSGSSLKFRIRKTILKKK